VKTSLFKIFVLIFLCSTINAQTIQVTPFSLDNDLRYLQLNNRLFSNHSLTIRPISFSKKNTPDSLYKFFSNNHNEVLKERKVEFLNSNGKVSLLPVRSVSKFNSSLPYGWSDGILMPAKGMQQYFSLGVFSSLGPLSIQLAPEILYAQNLPYETTKSYGDANPLKSKRKFSLGQSKVSLNINAFSIGLSNENIWWGPGQFTSLIMTNNAPGFEHISLNSNRPINTFLGKIEFQLLSGRLRANDNNPEDVFNRKTHFDRIGSEQLEGDYFKYLNAIDIVVQPKFIKNLFIGFNRVFVSRDLDVLNSVSSRVGAFNTYLPIFDGLFKEKRNAFEDSLKWNQLASLYFRYVFEKAKAEVYFEYGWNDHAYNMRDFMVSPSHSAAFLVGAKKIVNLKNNKNLDFNVEYNQLSQSTNYLVRDAGSWYKHGYYAHLSNDGETLGSGVGYGTDMLSISAQLRDGLDYVGIKLHKIRREPSVYEHNWNDMVFTFMFRKQVKSFLINVDPSMFYSKNYGWIQNSNRFNFMGMMGVSYFF
jgi:hypothetical protein